VFANRIPFSLLGGTSLLGNAGKHNVIGAFLWRTKEAHAFDWVHPYAKEDLIREFEKWRPSMPAEFIDEYETLCTSYALFLSMRV
jgi:hypothetical protein